ncbi:hypothetical protein J5N97_008702 [Dioscorea zingiberensis]|uniref:Protein transport protein Sec24-like At3g07100 n=1 Tax=Dioscorea zingiberensis TaxID=325984 RepID=A0A9D5HLL9_9LILI|nr:hypothetical protein J5N97_008702 [Dioscorea zingiberensis]
MRGGAGRWWTGLVAKRGRDQGFSIEAFSSFEFSIPRFYIGNSLHFFKSLVEDFKMQNYGNHILNASGKLSSFMRKFLFSIISFGPMPNHIAFIMDGNRRYAKKQIIEQNIGYRKGFSALLPILQYSVEMGVKYVTVYAFSIDNFKRSSDEVQSLMDLMKEKIDELSKKESIVKKYGIRINFWGDMKLLNETVRLAAEELMAATAENTGPVLSVCVAYTSTCEIIHAVQEFCSERRSYHLQGAHSKGLVSVVDLEQHLVSPSRHSHHLNSQFPDSISVIRFTSSSPWSSRFGVLVTYYKADMHPSGNEKPFNAPGRPAMPFPAASQASAPFLSSGPVAGFEASGAASRTTPPFLSSGALSNPGVSGAPLSMMPPLSSRPIAGQETSGYRTPPPQARFNGPTSPPQSSFSVQDPNSFQQAFPQFPPTSQPVYPLRSSPFGAPPVVPSLGPPSPAQVPTVPMGPPPQIANHSPPRVGIIPPVLDSSVSQPPFTGYPNASPLGNMPQPQFPAGRPVSRPTSQTFSAPNVPPYAPFNAHQGGFVPPPPPIGASLGFNARGQTQYPTAGPPLEGTLQGLIEDFQSLSVAPAPGTLDHGIDPKLLPRPLEGDNEPTSILETYPLNCHPRYLRLTTHAIPSSQSLLARWHLPLGIVVHPLAEAHEGEEVPVVNFGPAGVVRCRRCRTYVNPYVTFTDAGRKWRCNLCSLLNDVPGEYFCALDASGRRCDIDQRPELSKGSVEIVAPTEYMVRPPMPPMYFFLIDVSLTAVQSGLLEVVSKTIKACLDELPGFPRTQIGFITFDSTLHFYSLKSSSSQPQMMVVADLEDIFLPMPDDLLVNLSDSRGVVDALLDSLPSMFQDNVNVESAFGPALKAAFMVMSKLGGKLLVFQSTLPSLGVGRLRLRGEDLRVYGTDKEHSLRTPEDPFYKQMAAEFTKCQIAVDIFTFSDKYSDIASLGTLAKYTGGQVYYYPSFHASIHEEKLKHDLARDLIRETAWEAVMRIRCGKGVRFTTYHGHFMLRSTDLLALPAVDCDKAFAMQLSLEETLLTTQTVYFQVALLYTSSSGERRIRVLTTAVPVVSDLGEMYRLADTGAILSVMSRLAIENSLTTKLEDARQLLQLKIVKSLREYRNLYAVQHRLAGRLIFPESLKFLPLYVLSLCKTIALRGGYTDASLDERCAAGFNMMILPIGRLLKLLYPSLIRIDEILLKASDKSDVLEQLALTTESLDSRGLYIYDNGFNFIIWFGRMLFPDIVTSILGVDFSTFPDLSRATLFERDNEISRKLMKILAKARVQDPSTYQLCHLVRQGEQPRESALFLSNMIEDQTASTSGYRDWILQIYRQTQQGS